MSNDATAYHDGNPIGDVCAITRRPASACAVLRCHRAVLPGGAWQCRRPDAEETGARRKQLRRDHAGHASRDETLVRGQPPCGGRRRLLGRGGCVGSVGGAAVAAAVEALHHSEHGQPDAQRRYGRRSWPRLSRRASCASLRVLPAREPSIYLSIDRSIDLSIDLSICLSIHPSLRAAGGRVARVREGCTRCSPDDTRSPGNGTNDLGDTIH